MQQTYTLDNGRESASNCDACKCKLNVNYNVNLMPLLDAQTVTYVAFPAQVMENA